jgi:PDZ domain-containing protein
MARMRLTPAKLLLAGAALLVVVLLIAATAPSDDFLFIPDTAKPVAAQVTVEGGSEPQDGGGIYFVDVSLRRVRWLERVLPFLRPEGASLVPSHAVISPGQSFADRRVEAREEMDRSEQTAAAVAMKAAGLEVETTLRGLRIENVLVDTPAVKVLETGDVIVGAEGRPVRTIEQLRDALARLAPGERVRLRLRRDGKTIDRMVATVASPSDGERAIIGIQVGLDAAIELPREVAIDLGDIGGPSAGLPFALQVYQELGNDVDRGLRVAATGAIELDGSVLPVGGLQQKTIGVRRAGADVFLVPTGENAQTARRYAGGLRIIPVESFRQALRVLRTLPQK